MSPIRQKRGMLEVALGLGDAGWNAARRGDAFAIACAALVTGCAGARDGELGEFVMRANLVGTTVSTLTVTVSAADIPTLAAASFLVVSVGTVAAYIPARRASRADPLTTLRAE